MAEPLVILGAGAAGLSAALHAGADVPLYERAADPGGLCRSHQVDRYRFDETAHVLYFRDEGVKQLVHSLLGDNLQAYHRQARVYAHGRYLRYPFQAHLHGLPDDLIDECIQGRVDAEEARARNGHPPASFEAWILASLGEGIARHFMNPYNNKFWTVPPSTLTHEWAERFVPVPSLVEMRRGAMGEDPTEYGYNVQFAYPRQGGVASLMQALVARVPGIQLGKRVTQIDLARSQIQFRDGTSVTYQHAISTIPLPEMRRLLQPLPEAIARAFDRLRWVSLYVLHLGVRDEVTPGFDWAYFPQPELPFFRVGCPSRYSPDSAPAGSRTMSVELTYSTWQPLNEEGLTPRILEDLIRVGLLKNTSTVEVIYPVRAAYGYPIYDHAYHEATQTIIAFLRRHGIIPAGRFGRWAYLSLEDSILDGNDAAAEAGFEIESRIRPLGSTSG